MPGGSLRERAKRFRITAGIVLLVSGAVAGCSTDVDLKPRVGAAADRVPYTQMVGFNLVPLLQTPDQAAEPYHQRHIAKFNIGPASADLFRSVIPTMFATAVEVDHHPPLTGDGADLSAVIEPKLESFHFYSLVVGEWRFWADVTYRFDLYTSDGILTASWTTRGEGEDVGTTHGESGTWARAVELAMERAAKRFAESFETIPEAIRWRKGLLSGGAVAAEELQETRAIEADGVAGAVGTYEHVVRVRMELDPPEFREVVKQLPERERSRVMAVKLVAENVSGRRLALLASRVHLVTSGEETIQPLPLTLAAALLTQQQMRLGPVRVGRWIRRAAGIVRDTGKSRCRAIGDG